MDMAEQLPHILVCALITKKGKVTEVYSLFAYPDMHLHGHVLKPAYEPLTHACQVVIAEYQVDFAIQSGSPNLFEIIFLAILLIHRVYKKVGHLERIPHLNGYR